MPDNDTNHAPEPPGQRRPRARAARRRALSGSERARPAGHDIIGPADADDELAVTIVVRPKAGAPPLPDLGYWQRTPLRERRFLTAGEYAERYGADPADLDAVAAFATAHGLTVLDSHAGRHTVSVLGTVGQLNAAFGVTLNRYRDHLPPQHPRSPEMAAARHAQPEQAHSEHYGYDGAVQLPADIAGVVAGSQGWIPGTWACPPETRRAPLTTRSRSPRRVTTSPTPAPVIRPLASSRCRTPASRVRGGVSQVRHHRLLLSRLADGLPEGAQVDQRRQPDRRDHHLQEQPRRRSGDHQHRDR